MAMEFPVTESSGAPVLRARALASAIAGALALALTGAQAQALMPAGMGASSTDGAAREPLAPGQSQFAAGARTGLMLSNNLDLRPDSLPSSGSTLFEISPWSSYRTMTSRGLIEARAILRGQYREGASDAVRLRTTLSASGDLRLHEDWLHLAARTSVQQINVDPFSANSADPSSQVANTSTLKHVEISPYARGRFDGNGLWHANYSLRYIDPGVSGATASIGSNVNQTLRLGLRTDLSRRTLGLSLDGRQSRVDYNSGFDYQMADLEALGWWRASAALRVGAGAGWFRHDLLRNSDGKYESIGGVVSAQWNPSPRTSASLRWADQHSREHLSANLDHRFGRWTYRASYLRALQDGNATILSNQTSLAALLAQQAQTRSLSESDFQVASLVRSPVVRTEHINLGASAQGARTTLHGNLFLVDRASVVSLPGLPVIDLQQRGAWLAASYRLDGSQSLNLGLRYTQSDSDLNDAHARLTTLTGSWDTRLTPRWSLSLGARAQRQTARGNAVAYDEAAVFATTHIRFQ
jgi:uncharacterized protein (PEP-CTERM system associated)